MNGIVAAAVVVGALGLVIGLLLSLAAKKFAVETDERVGEVRELLPGVNCGSCGFAGCDACAEALVSGEAKLSACPVVNSENRGKIGELLGIAAEEGVKLVAFVACDGTCEKTPRKYVYYGIKDCRDAAAMVGNGDKACSFGCLGYGTCEANCQFDAIHVVNGVAVVDKDKCQHCGMCVRNCPKHLIRLIPYDDTMQVYCSNTGRGASVKKTCDSGCIGCGLCAKNCEAGAITMENNLPVFDESKCTMCGKCAEKCPASAIHVH